MQKATELQKTIIDDQRHEQCGHPMAKNIPQLTWLSCRRCGCMFVDGKVKQIDVILKEDENGETHISSYADDSQPVPVMTLNMESPTLKLIADMRDGLRLVLNQLHNRETFNATELGSRIEPLILRADELLRQLL